MKATLIALVILLVHGAVSPLSVATVAPTPTPRVRFVVLDDYIRDTLAVEWERHAHDTPILERIYCVKYQRDYWAGEPAYRVTQLTAGDSVRNEPTHSYIACPKGFGNAVLHTHPPETCDPWGCYPGGSYAYQCLPSDDDTRFLAWREDAFGLIACDAHAVVAYWAP